MEELMNAQWPGDHSVRFWLVQIVFWTGYSFIVGVIGTAPFRSTRFRQSTWSSFVLGAVGLMCAFVSQFLFDLDKQLDMLGPYVFVFSILAVAISTAAVGVFSIVFPQEEYDDDRDSCPEERRRRVRERVEPSEYPPRQTYYVQEDDEYDELASREQHVPRDYPPQQRSAARPVRRRMR